MREPSEKEIFETLPVHRAVAALAVPTIISQIVSIVYNLADTFFIGRMGDPHMVAAVTLAAPWFNLLTALGNLFGIGGGSLASRLLGAKREDEVKYISSFCFYGGMAATGLFALFSFCGRGPLLRFLGAGPENYDFAEVYFLWVVVLGGVPTMLSLTLGHLLRSEGHARQASLGMMLGGVLNMLLDPLLMFGLSLGFAGAGIATACSNLVSCLFFLWCFGRLRGETALSLSAKAFRLRFAGQVFSVGLASALTTGLANIANMTIVKLASGYGDIAVAAYGVVKRVDLLPLGINMGLCQGFMPLVSYNYAAKDYRRMREISYFSWKTALIIGVSFVAAFLAFAPWIVMSFIPEEQTILLGTSFLRIACLATPLMSVNALIIYTLQAMGKGLQSSFLTLCRQGALNVPLLILMNHAFGLYGMIWTQLTVELLMLPVTFGMYRATSRKLKKGEEISR